MNILVVTGGSIQDDFAVEYIRKKKFDQMIAADSGMEFFYRMGMVPQHIVGDFDSAKPEILSYFRKQDGIEFLEFRPEKDETDTELALTLALTLGAEKICVLGATGTRLDHVLGNIHLLCKPLEKGVSCVLVDANNRIRLIADKFLMKKEEQFGKYVSFLPLTTQAEGVTLRGFKYPLSGYTMTSDNSLGVSNEILADTAEVEIESGILIMIESRDSE